MNIEDELGEFYQTHHRRLLGYFARTRGAAEDLAQETWLAFWLAMRRGHSNPEALLRYIARRRLVSLLRRRRNSEALVADVAEAVERRASAGGQAAPDVSLDVLSALRALGPGRDRDVLILTYYYDFDQYMVAETLEIKVHDVKNSLRSGRQKLRDGGLLAEYDPGREVDA